MNQVEIYQAQFEELKAKVEAMKLAEQPLWTEQNALARAGRFISQDLYNSLQTAVEARREVEGKLGFVCDQLANAKINQALAEHRGPVQPMRLV